MGHFSVVSGVIHRDDFDTPPVVAAQSSSLATETLRQNCKTRQQLHVSRLAERGEDRLLASFAVLVSVKMRLDTRLRRYSTIGAAGGQDRWLSRPRSGRVETTGARLDTRVSPATRRSGARPSTVGDMAARRARRDSPSARCQPLARPCPVDALLLQSHALPELVLDEGPVEVLLVG